MPPSIDTKAKRNRLARRREPYWYKLILGGFIGLVFGLTLAGISTFRYREDYEPNKGTCLSCARCLDYCPVKPGDELSGMNHLEI